MDGNFQNKLSNIVKLSPSSSSSWAELVLFSIYTPTHPPPARNSSEIAGNQVNLLCNICRSTPVEPKIIWKKKIEKSEEDLHGRRPL